MGFSGRIVPSFLVGLGLGVPEVPGEDSRVRCRYRRVGTSGGKTSENTGRGHIKVVKVGVSVGTGRGLSGPGKWGPESVHKGRCTKVDLSNVGVTDV